MYNENQPLENQKILLLFVSIHTELIREMASLHGIEKKKIEENTPHGATTMQGLVKHT